MVIAHEYSVFLLVFENEIWFILRTFARSRLGESIFLKITQQSVVLLLYSFSCQLVLRTATCLVIDNFTVNFIYILQDFVENKWCLTMDDSVFKDIDGSCFEGLHFAFYSIGIFWNGNKIFQVLRYCTKRAFQFLWNNSIIYSKIWFFLNFVFLYS